MAIYKNDIADIDLNTGTIHRTFANHMIGESDADANRYGIRLWRGGEPVDIGGATCMGYFIRHGHGDTVTINGGAFSGQEAYVELPDSCYAYEGGFTLVIKLVGGSVNENMRSSVTGTMRIVDGIVVDSMIGSPVDPGGVVPNLDELLAVIGRAEAAAGTIADLAIYAEQVEGDNYRIVVNTGS